MQADRQEFPWFEVAMAALGGLVVGGGIGWALGRSGSQASAQGLPAGGVAAAGALLPSVKTQVTTDRAPSIGKPRQEAVVADVAPVSMYSVDVDGLLRTCPTAAEIATIRRDIHIEFDDGVLRATGPGGMGVTRPDCTPGVVVGRGRSDVLLCLFNALRAMKLITFDRPMPILNTTNLYEWWVQQGITIHVVSSSALASNAVLGSRRVNILEGVFSGPGSGTFWSSYTPSHFAGLYIVVGLLVHEARHAMTGGKRHDMADHQTDSSLGYGGAWAAHYWYFRWLTEHSDRYLTVQEKIDARGMATEILPLFHTRPTPDQLVAG